MGLSKTELFTYFQNQVGAESMVT